MNTVKEIALFFTLAFALILGACSGDTTKTEEKEPAQEVTLTVFAAASLKSTFTELAKEFEAENEGVTVALNFDGSSNLVAQIQDGAPADVFASSDVNNMTKAEDAKLVEGKSVLFATNILQIATPPDNPAGIKSFADLAKPGVKLVICAEPVPCGSATAQVAKNAGVTLSPVSEEQNVTDVLGKVRSGEADAGLVYVTDVISAGDDVHGIVFPEASSVVNEYPIAALSNSKHKDLASAFVTFMTSAKAQSVFKAAGFGQP